MSESSADNSVASDVTRLLNASPNDRTAAEELLRLVYDQLHHIAQQRMAGKRRDHTLQAIALVQEAYRRLVGDDMPQPANIV